MPVKEEAYLLIPNIWIPFDSPDDNLNIHIIPSGKITDNPAALLESTKIEKLITFAQARYDLIIIDTAPVTKVIDTLILGKSVKNVIMIVRPNHTFKESIPFAISEMNQFEMKIKGSIINAFDLSQASGRYKYGYGYGYGYGKDSKQKV